MWSNGPKSWAEGNVTWKADGAVFSSRKNFWDATVLATKGKVWSKRMPGRGSHKEWSPLGMYRAMVLNLSNAATLWYSWGCSELYHYKIISLPPHNCNFTAVMHHNVDIWVFWWSLGSPAKGSFNPQRSCDPQVVICWWRGNAVLKLKGPHTSDLPSSRGGRPCCPKLHSWQPFAMDDWRGVQKWLWGPLMYPQTG